MMKTVIELEKNIMALTSSIHQEFPELSKYIIEMPINNAAEEEINTKNLKDYYNSLQALVSNYAKTHTVLSDKKDSESNMYPGYPPYPAAEDIYQQSTEESEINPEDPTQLKTPNDEDGLMNEKSFKNHMSGRDLDVPGAELDDEQEDNGNEDEENNSYSIGGDAHNDLEEDNG